jgi:predicted  nucleic acid-binding Zn-ribbon protein
MSTPPTLAEQVARDIAGIEIDLRKMHSQVRLSSLRDRLEDLETCIKGLPQKVENIRARQYAFESNLENRAADFRQRWSVTRNNVHSEIRRQSAQLEAALPPIETLYQQLVARKNNSGMAQPLVTRLKSEISNLSSKTDAAERSIQGMYDKFESEVNTFTRHLDRIEWTLTQFEQACFLLLPTEGGIRAVKAAWLKANKKSKDDPKGNLYLTDQRLLFEQKEEVPTKKVLFITTAREKRQSLLIEAPVASVEKITASKQGMLKNEDHLELCFDRQSPYSIVMLHLNGQDCNEWQALINQVKAGDFDTTRAITVDHISVEKARSAPTLCPSCGGAITQKILRGMDSITCDYCGGIIRL